MAKANNGTIRYRRFTQTVKGVGTKGYGRPYKVKPLLPKKSVPQDGFIIINS